jgi:hypothetical protein
MQHHLKDLLFKDGVYDPEETIEAFSHARNCRTDSGKDFVGADAITGGKCHLGWIIAPRSNDTSNYFEIAIALFSDSIHMPG